MQRVCAILWSVTCPNLEYIFFTLCHKRHDFRKTVLRIKCVLWCSPQSLSEIILVIRRTERDMIKMYIGLHVKYPLFFSDFNETWIFSTDLWKILKYQIIWKFGRWEPSCSMWTERRNMTKLRFSQFYEKRLTKFIPTEMSIPPSPFVVLLPLGGSER